MGGGRKSALGGGRSRELGGELGGTTRWEKWKRLWEMVVLIGNGLEEGRGADGELEGVLGAVLVCVGGTRGP